MTSTNQLKTIMYSALIVCILSLAFATPLKHHHSKSAAKTVNPSKKALAKDFNMVGQDLKACKYNDQEISHGTIGYQDVCGKFTCTDGYMAWYYFPNAAAFDICHVPYALLKQHDEHHLVMDNIPSYSTKSSGEKMERISVIGGPTHGFVEHADDNPRHDDPHTAMLQTTTIDVKAAHSPHGQPTVEVHDPVVHTGAISVTDHGGHHGEVVTNTVG